MKTYLTVGFCLIFSSSLMANTQYYQLKKTTHFISHPEAVAFSLSTITGLNNQTQQRLAHIQAKVSTNGMFFNRQNQTIADLNLHKTHNIGGKAHSIKKMSEQGARDQLLNYKSLVPGQGRGFEQVQGKQMGSRLGHYSHGVDTADDTLKVAHHTLQSPTASPSIKRAARAVIQAYKIRQQLIKVAHPVAGQPKQTLIKALSGKTPTFSNLNVLFQNSLPPEVMGTILGGGLELANSVVITQTIDWERVGGMALLSGASNYMNNFTSVVIQQALVNNHSQLLAILVPNQVSAPLLGGASGSVIAGAVFSYGAYFLGYSDLKTANRNMMATSLGATAGVLGSAATFGLVSTFGAASTGTAIASLSGAAATNATLAWIGGGSLAAGGGGVAAGATILSGGAALIAIGVGAGIMYLYHAGDEATEHERVNHLLNQLHH